MNLLVSGDGFFAFLDHFGDINEMILDATGAVMIHFP